MLRAVDEALRRVTSSATAWDVGRWNSNDANAAGTTGQGTIVQQTEEANVGAMKQPKGAVTRG